MHLYDKNLSYVHGASSVPLLGTTIGDLLDRVAEQMPDNEALVSRHQGLRYTYRQLQAESNRFARGLIACGIIKGDRVGIWSPNYAEWVITQFATAKIGAILVNINPAYRSSELEYALEQSGCSALIIAPADRTSNYLSQFREVCPELDTSRPGELSSQRLRQLHTVITLGSQRVDGAYAWDQVMAKADDVPYPDLVERQRLLHFDEAINIQYTSGTTGFPKGATLSHHSILNNGFFVGERMRFTEKDRLCIPVSLYHCFGMVCGNLACVTHGATIVLPSEFFEPRKTIEALAEERCTAVLGVPTMFIAELGLPDLDRFDLSSMRTGCMGGAPCPIEVMKQVTNRMHMEEVTIVYGMTETAPITIQTVISDDLEKRVSTVGRIHPHVECKIVDPTTGATVPRGVTGELLTRGYVVMLGYWNSPEATSQAIDSSRWMHTGDLARMDEEGYVNIVGRSKDMIIRAGEKVFPREVEEFLYTHPAVQDVQVIGIPDVLYGEKIMAWVIIKPGHQVAEDDLTNFCRGSIAAFKVPRFWRFVDSFPMTVSGKVQKFKLREMAVKELGLEEDAAVLTA